MTSPVSSLWEWLRGSAVFIGRARASKTENAVEWLDWNIIPSFQTNRLYFVSVAECWCLRLSWLSVLWPFGWMGEAWTGSDGHPTQPFNLQDWTQYDIRLVIYNTEQISLYFNPGVNPVPSVALSYFGLYRSFNCLERRGEVFGLLCQKRNWCLGSVTQSFRSLREFVVVACLYCHDSGAETEPLLVRCHFVWQEHKN